jgi:predicted RNA binding protein YcfA (HicA-like mRNA interferase family)
MSQKKKLREKLKNGHITALELRRLLQQEGFVCARTRGSHEAWIKLDRTLILATHSNTLKRYQIKEARAAIFGEEELSDED